jgi:hypothetical protein
MRYRALSAEGDYTFGQGNANFLINVPAAVGQAARTRLLLITDEWFLDFTEGTPWGTQILGSNTQATRDLAIKSRLLGTPGLTQIARYASTVEARKFIPEAVLDTVYGQTENIAVTLP